MMRGNVGGDDIKGNFGTLADHMAAFDALPHEIRRQMTAMSINWNGGDVLTVCRSHGVPTTLALLRKTERDMQGAYRERIGP